MLTCLKDPAIICWENRLKEVEALSESIQKAIMALSFFSEEGTISYSSSECQLCGYNNVNYFTLSTVKL